MMDDKASNLPKKKRHKRDSIATRSPRRCSETRQATHSQRELQLESRSLHDYSRMHNKNEFKNERKRKYRRRDGQHEKPETHVRAEMRGTCMHILPCVMQCICICNRHDLQWAERKFTRRFADARGSGAARDTLRYTYVPFLAFLLVDCSIVHFSFAFRDICIRSLLGEWCEGALARASHSRTLSICVKCQCNFSFPFTTIQFDNVGNVPCTKTLSRFFIIDARACRRLSSLRRNSLRCDMSSINLRLRRSRIVLQKFVRIRGVWIEYFHRNDGIALPIRSRVPLRSCSSKLNCILLWTKCSEHWLRINYIIIY